MSNAWFRVAHSVCLWVRVHWLNMYMCVCVSVCGCWEMHVMRQIRIEQLPHRRRLLLLLLQLPRLRNSVRRMIPGINVTSDIDILHLLLMRGQQRSWSRPGMREYKGPCQFKLLLSVYFLLWNLNSVTLHLIYIVAICEMLMNGRIKCLIRMALCTVKVVI